jgi:hypothetical protein
MTTYAACEIVSEIFILDLQVNHLNKIVRVATYVYATVVAIPLIHYWYSTKEREIELVIYGTVI